MKPFNVAEIELLNNNLIEAGAGTGKTYNITFLVLRLLIEKNLPIDEILVVTFTEAAASELKEKIRARLKETLCAIEKKKRGRGRHTKIYKWLKGQKWSKTKTPKGHKGL
jgi:exodeoxyribonuclease V beta subunit